MISDLTHIIIAVAILGILFFAYTTKSKLASYVTYTILASIALTMVLNGLAGLISGVDFLAFLEDFLNLISDIVVFVELGVILYLLFMKQKTKVMALKVFILVYVVLTLLVEFDIIS